MKCFPQFVSIDMILLKIGTLRAMGMKNVLFLEVGESASTPPTQLLIRIVLLHTEKGPGKKKQFLEAV